MVREKIFKYDYIYVTKFLQMKSYLFKYFTVAIFVLLFSAILNAQSNQHLILNDVIEELVGEHGKIESFKTLKDACKSEYVTCNNFKKRIIGLDFQFANLNGTIPDELFKLKSLQYINLEYNYLSGPIPSGFSKLHNLKQILLNGNFLTGPLPEDLVEMGQDIVVDLAENTINTQDRKLIRNLNVVDQINLQSCRSPDSIFLRMSHDKNYIDAVLGNEFKKSFGTYDIQNDNGEYKDSEPNDASDGLPEDDPINLPEGTPIDAPADVPADNSLKKDSTKEIIKVVESMPRFPGCEEDDLSFREREKCAQGKMLEYIYTHLKYPYQARVLGVQGMVVLQFVILKNGDIGYVSVVRDIGGRCGNAALWIVNRMNYICEKWVPGVQRGRNVKVLYTLPISYASMIGMVLCY